MLEAAKAALPPLRNTATPRRLAVSGEAEEEMEAMRQKIAALQAEKDDLSQKLSRLEEQHSNVRSRDEEEEEEAKARKDFESFILGPNKKEMNKEEFLEAVKNLGAVEEKPDELFTEMDRNKNGKIEFNEWLIFYKAAPLLAMFAAGSREDGAKETPSNLISRFSFTIGRQLLGKPALFVGEDEFVGAPPPLQARQVWPLLACPVIKP